jgi:hypothetical protein
LATGLNSFVSLSGTTTVTDAVGLWLTSATNSGGGTIINNYGIYIEDQIAGVNDYGIRIDGADTYAMWLGAGADNTDAANGITFGASGDTNLYRGGTDLLSTDDSLAIAEKIQIGGDVGTTSQCNLLFSGYINCNALAEIADVSTETTINSYGLRNSLHVNPVSNNSAANVAGENNLVLGEDGSAIDFTNIAVGNKGAVTVFSTGTVSAAVGGSFGVQNTHIGTITDSVGVVANNINLSTGTINSSVAIFAGDVHNPSGTVTDNYGLYVADMVSGTNNYGILVEGADTYALWLGAGADNTDAANGITFGASGDTNLYRNAADTLKTDDNLEVAQNLTVGTTLSPFYRLHVYSDDVGDDPTYVANFFHDGDDDQQYGVRIQAGADDGSGTTVYLDAYDGDGTQVGYIANTSGTFALTDISDARTKTNIANTSVQGLDVINNLRVADFNRMQNPDGPLITGFIAQEVQEVYGQAVSVGPDGLLGIQKDAFIPVLIKGVQEQQQQIDTLKGRIASLEQQIGSSSGSQAALSTPSTQQTLKVTGTATIATLEVTGNARFAGNITVEGDLNLKSKILGNSLTRGKVTVETGTTEVKYTFDKAYATAPNVTLTATNTFAPRYRVEATKQGFTVYLEEVSIEPVIFNYQVQQ